MHAQNVVVVVVVVFFNYNFVAFDVVVMKWLLFCNPDEYVIMNLHSHNTNSS